MSGKGKPSGCSTRTEGIYSVLSIRITLTSDREVHFRPMLWHRMLPSPATVCTYCVHPGRQYLLVLSQLLQTLIASSRGLQELLTRIVSSSDRLWSRRRLDYTSESHDKFGDKWLLAPRAPGVTHSQLCVAYPNTSRNTVLYSS